MINSERIKTGRRPQSAVPEMPDPGSGIAHKLATARALVATLSQRERRILHMAVAGQQNKAVAIALGIHVLTLKVHRTRIMARLGVRTFAAAVRVAALAELASCVRHNRTTQGILEELLAKYWADRDTVGSTAPGGRASQSGQ
jgi:DNA-binding CsgD family transcriptional regulator